ncbi:MAG: hypothetical protein K0Q65_1068 [Clostridia bacterium]|jgi:hypothetical protein|nr:hypothetical protein [Clostridia bacterium]
MNKNYEELNQVVSAVMGISDHKKNPFSEASKRVTRLTKSELKERQELVLKSAHDINERGQEI